MNGLFSFVAGIILFKIANHFYAKNDKRKAFILICIGIIAYIVFVFCVKE